MLRSSRASKARSWILLPLSYFSLHLLCLGLLSRPSYTQRRYINFNDAEPFSGQGVRKVTSNEANLNRFAEYPTTLRLSSESTEFWELLYGDDDIPVDPNMEHDEAEIFDLSSNHTDMFKVPLTLDKLSEAFAANVSYFYLQNEVGLSDLAMWRITYEANSVLAMTTSSVKHKIATLREAVGLNDDELRQIIERQPTILHLSADNNILPTSLYLMRTLNLRRNDLRDLVIAQPCLLNYSTRNLRSKISFFKRFMKYSEDDCRALFLKNPRLFRTSVESLVSHARFFLDDVELPHDKFQRVVQKNPATLLYSVNKNLAPKIVFFMMLEQHMSLNHIHKLLVSYPQILDYNLDRKIRPVALYFEKELDYSYSEFHMILLRFPKLFAYSLVKIKHSVGYFRFEIGMSASQVKRILYRSPTVLALNAEGNVRPKLEHLKKELQLSDEELRTVVATMPSVLTLSLSDNLAKKIRYLRKVFQPKELRENIIRFPTLLGYSLDKRIRPRIEAIVAADLDPSCIRMGIPLKEEAFHEWLRLRTLKSGRRQQEKILDSTVPSVESSSSSNRIVHWSRPRSP